MNTLEAGGEGWAVAGKISVAYVAVYRERSGFDRAQR